MAAKPTTIIQEIEVELSEVLEEEVEEEEEEEDR